ncbi:MAG: S1C family serine protease [Burkholderiaceae bacterium]|nr:S1C family serine protease [Burkholderiaceae bacterium]
MSDYRKIFLVALLCLPVVAIAAAHSSPINVSSMEIKKTAQLKVWKNNIEPGTSLGAFGSGLFCSDKETIYLNKNIEQYNVVRFTKVYGEKLEALGFPKYEGDESAFADKLGKEADFKVGFTMLALNYDSCGDNKEMSGKASVKFKVEMFSTKSKKVVYSATLNGSYASEKKIKIEAFDDALFSSALDVMFSDPQYVEIFKDGEPATSLLSEQIEVANGSKIAEGIKKSAKDVLNLVATVESTLGTGSAFFIGNAGYLISNYHVVGEAKFVKVKFANGLSTVGEVVRRDAVRDVALIKTAVEPARSIAVRRSPAKIGEEVYAIGSPFGDQLSGTTTRGIVSADRTIENQRFIQSDVSINPGNSGGPLVDNSGEALAIAVLSRKDAAGIGMFIPIVEALEKLGLTLK